MLLLSTEDKDRRLGILEKNDGKHNKMGWMGLAQPLQTDFRRFIVGSERGDERFVTRFARRRTSLAGSSDEMLV